VPWRVDPERGLEVLVIHRPRYDDWSFPKGKREGDESDERCALRELREETGLEGVLGRELPHCEYIDGKGRFKTVRYWELTVTGGAFVPNDEVDELRWAPLPVAGAMLSYERDRRVLERFAVFAGAV
jgi:8-oxo-dGTP diphosphatase